LKREFYPATIRFGEMLLRTQVLPNVSLLEHYAALAAANVTRNFDMDDCGSVNEDIVQILRLFWNPPDDVDVSSDRLQTTTQE
jgi:hypothetical protein